MFSKPSGVHKIQSFGAKMLEGTKKPKLHQPLGFCWALHGVGKILLQNIPKPWVPKNQSFGAKTLEGTKTTQKNKVWEHWDSKTLSFCSFRCSPAFWHQYFWFFGTRHGFGKVLLQNAPKTLRGPRKPKFFVPKRWRVPKNKNQVSEHWVIWQLKIPKLWFLFWYAPAFWHQNSVFV